MLQLSKLESILLWNFSILRLKLQNYFGFIFEITLPKSEFDIYFTMRFYKTTKAIFAGYSYVLQCNLAKDAPFPLIFCSIYVDNDF